MFFLACSHMSVLIVDFRKYCAFPILIFISNTNFAELVLYDTLCF